MKDVFAADARDGMLAAKGGSDACYLRACGDIDGRLSLASTSLIHGSVMNYCPSPHSIMVSEGWGGHKTHIRIAERAVALACTERNFNLSSSSSRTNRSSSNHDMKLRHIALRGLTHYKHGDKLQDLFVRQLLAAKADPTLPSTSPSNASKQASNSSTNAFRASTNHHYCTVPACLYHWKTRLWHLD